VKDLNGACEKYHKVGPACKDAVSTNRLTAEIIWA